MTKFHKIKGGISIVGILILGFIVLILVLIFILFLNMVLLELRLQHSLQISPICLWLILSHNTISKLAIRFSDFLLISY